MNNKRNIRFINLILMFFVLVLFVSCQQQKDDYREIIDLSGSWQFDIDAKKVGVEEEWFVKELSDVVKLPGTTDSNQKGFKNTDTTTMHLNRVYKYEGPAWYQKKVLIPGNWQNRNILLEMERTKSTKIWIDNQLVGNSHLLESPQYYNLSDFLSPGEHTLTICVDNNLKLTPFGNVHIYSDDTQTNWNGIIGDIQLTASSKTYISDLQVFPDIENKKIKVKLNIDNQLDWENIDVELRVSKKINNEIVELKPAKYNLPCLSELELEYVLDEQMDLWDEYSQPLYTLNAVISNNKIHDNLAVPFGMRKFDTKGTQFLINGRTTFLRGKNDACVFPLTGHPPMEKEGWLNVFKIVQSYGINHVRFHSWCPPNAAFEAADELGIYLQPELPFWGGLDSDTVADLLLDEGIALLKSYANHPSFVLFSAGNEIWSGHERVEKNMVLLKEMDGRPLYTQGSNNNIGYVGPTDYSDFHLAARTPSDGDDRLTHTRLTHAFADSENGATLNGQIPSTTVDFENSVEKIDIPLVSHEIGQYQIYPDFDEIKKYTGVLRANNLEVFKSRLEKAGMNDQNKDFTKASGAWSALCYRAEMEAAVRTNGFGGFQLLDLQDFPGQGTALVGILDAFMDSKNVVSREDWIQSCNDVVLLLEFEKYCWTNQETFLAEVKVANYSNKNLAQGLSWKAFDEKGNMLAEGSFTKEINLGGLQNIGEIKLPLNKWSTAQKINIELTIENTAYKNVYPLWIYPEPAINKTKDVILASKLDASTINQLEKGAKVLLFPKANSVEKNSVGGLFPPDFWNFGMFKGISEGNKKPVSPGTLGLLMNPEHPLLKSFPTEFHTNMQWWSIIRNSRPLILDLMENKYRPIVQVIDNMERNHKLGLVFEFKMGEGKLLVCMSDLEKIKDKPEAAQLYNSILNYMKSDVFNPDFSLDKKMIKQLSL